eukprot:2760331-Lingulodinium_polyedra.AAC.1
MARGVRARSPRGWRRQRLQPRGALLRRSGIGPSGPGGPHQLPQRQPRLAGPGVRGWPRQVAGRGLAPSVLGAV